MGHTIDEEVSAIKAVLTALEPLTPHARQSVLEYVVKRLELPEVPAGTGAPPPPAAPGISPPAASPRPPDSGIHIEKFKEQKNPRSANEMAAVVAYYLANVAPEGQRKKTVNTQDIETYFKIARFPLPQQVRFTLSNAKLAGYFDAAGNGDYKLNAVGHNLVVHSLPRDGESGVRPRKSSKKRR